MSTTYQGSVANYVNTLKLGRTTNNEQMLQALGQAIGEIYTNGTGGGTVTQLGAITTDVTVNAAAGTITTVSTTIAAGSNAEFIVTNSFAKTTSTIMLSMDDSASAGIGYAVQKTKLTGSFVINIYNIHPTNAFNNVLKIDFLIS